MRTIKALFAVGVLLFLTGAFGIEQTWTLAIGTMDLLVAGVALAVLLEDRDLTVVEGLAPGRAQVIPSDGAGRARPEAAIPPPSIPDAA